jgi:hypothetical protein
MRCVTDNECMFEEKQNRVWLLIFWGSSMFFPLFEIMAWFEDWRLRLDANRKKVSTEKKNLLYLL